MAAAAKEATFTGRSIGFVYDGGSGLMIRRWVCVSQTAFLFAVVMTALQRALGTGTGGTMGSTMLSASISTEKMLSPSGLEAILHGNGPPTHSSHHTINTLKRAPDSSPALRRSITDVTHRAGAGRPIPGRFEGAGEDSGNGSLMRLAPLALRHHADAARARAAAAESSLATHTGRLAAAA